MPNWNDLLNELKAEPGPHDRLRREYLKRLHDLTGRNVIAYYSGWLYQSELARKFPNRFALDEGDKTGFMTAVHKLDRKKGLDLVLHTPGGSLAAAESLVSYLRSMFGTDVRAIVPQIAMSAGTMIACSCKAVVMGKHSSLGPIDPQFGGRSAEAILEEFQTAIADVAANPAIAPIWQQMVSKYPIALIVDCQKAIQLSETLVKDWLRSGMFEGDVDADAKAGKIVGDLGSHDKMKAHDRQISIDTAKGLGIKVEPLEGSDELQDAVLSVHHLYTQTFFDAPTSMKIIENHKGVAFVHQIRHSVVQQIGG